KLNFSAPSTLIIHPQLARSDSFRLILRWNQLSAPGSSCVGQEYFLRKAGFRLMILLPLFGNSAVLNHKEKTRA
ncbi:MAG: hypothetical protein ACLQGT_13790, partial [Terracidiphilus sp.]